MTNGSLMKVKSIAECSKGSILQYFRSSSSDNRSENQLLVFLLSGRLRQVLLYMLKFPNATDSGPKFRKVGKSLCFFFYLNPYYRYVFFFLSQSLLLRERSGSVVES